MHLSSELYEPDGASAARNAVELAETPVVAYCDMEGQGDQGVRYDIKLATPMLLLSQVLILMIVCPNGPERDSVLNGTLATLLDAARQLHTGEEQGDQQGADQKEKDRFGHLHLVLRDCIQSEEECDEIIFGEEDSARAPDPESVEQRNRIRRDVLATFLSRPRVWCLPQLLQPAATDHRQNQPPAWVHKMDELRNVVKAQCCVPKQFGGQPLKSELLPEIMEQLKEALNSSDHPALNPRSLVEQSNQIIQSSRSSPLEGVFGVLGAAQVHLSEEEIADGDVVRSHVHDLTKLGEMKWRYRVVDKGHSPREEAIKVLDEAL